MQQNVKRRNHHSSLMRSIALSCVLCMLASCASTTRVRLDLTANDIPADATLVPCKVTNDIHGRPVFAPLASQPDEGNYTMVSFKNKHALAAYDIEITNEKNDNPLTPFAYLGGAILLAIPVGIAVGFAFMCTEDPDDPESEDCDGEDTDDQFRAGFIVGAAGAIGWGFYKFFDETRRLFVNNTEKIRTHTNYRYDSLGRLSHMMVTPFEGKGAYSSVQFMYNGSSMDPFDREAFSYNTDPQIKYKPESDDIFKSQ